MKKIIIVTGLLVSFASFGVAQNDSDDAREKLQLGIKAGLNFSNVYDAKGDDFSADPKFGLAAGVLLAIPIGKYLGIQPEIQVSQKGFKATGVILGEPYDFTRTTTYIDVPVQIAFKPMPFLTILGGPQYSYLAKQHDVFKSPTTTYAQEQEFKNDNIRRNIFGLVGGVDFNLSHIVFGARVGWDVQNNNGDGTSSTPRYKNVWFQGTIGFKFY